MKRSGPKLIIGLGVALFAASLHPAGAAADVSNAAGHSFTVTAGAEFDGPVAEFSSTYAELTNFSATIDWGDGTPETTGRISSCPSCPRYGYDVDGTHTYAGTGTFTVTIVIESARDSTTGTAIGTANVTDSDTPPPAPPSAQPGAVVGTPGDDVLHGTAGKNSIYGLGGNDLIIGASGNDILIGGPGNDKMKAGPGRDQIIPGHGRDKGMGGAGGDELYDMDDLRDRLNGGSGRELVYASTKEGLQAAKKVEALHFVGEKAIVANAKACFGSCGDSGLYRVHADGSGPEIQPGAGANSWDPAWSPNGVRLAFGKGGYVRTINSDGTGLKKLAGTGEADDWAPAWSPDGTKIAFTSNGQIWVMAADGSAAVQLTDSVGENASPAWTPDGTRIWFSRHAGAAPGANDWELWSMNPDGSAQTQVTDNDVHDRSPAFSPDGKLLAWTSTSEGASEVLLRFVGFPLLPPAVLVDGSGPAFSASGQEVVFVGGVAEAHLFRVNIGGSGLAYLDGIVPVGYHSNPSWRW